MQRILIIAAVVIVLAGVAVAGYFYFFNTSAGVEVAPEGSISFPVAGQEPLSGPDDGSADTLAHSISPPVSVSARLVKVSAGPVVPGAVVVNKKATASSTVPSTSLGTGETTVTYIERQSGNVYSYLVNTNTRTRISNRTLPGIQSALWLPDASVAFVRYLSGADFSTINTYALRADGSEGFFLPQNLSDIAVSSTSTLSLSSGVNGSIASLSRVDGAQTKEIFTTPLSSIRISFAGKSQYLAFTKPSASLSGNAFLVDSTGRFFRVAGPLNGLVAKASPSGKWVLVSHTNEGTTQMNLVNTTNGESLPLPVATLADKCVWAADDSAVYCGVPVNPPKNVAYPDDWYQGAVSFSDRIWKIDVSGRFAQFVLDFSKETDEPLDATALAVDSAHTVLVFVNKNDDSLWSYSL